MDKKSIIDDNSEYKKGPLFFGEAKDLYFNLTGEIIINGHENYELPIIKIDNKYYNLKFYKLFILMQQTESWNKLRYAVIQYKNKKISEEDYYATIYNHKCTAQKDIELNDNEYVKLMSLIAIIADIGFNEFKKKSEYNLFTLL
jgi:hypothetical protein